MTWQRSSLCATDHQTGNCVEAAVDTEGLVKLRDSREPGTVLLLDPGDWAAFKAGVAVGDFDDLPTIDEGAL
jgi:hypothetical protein